jgi:two-component system NtrC family sensor kinase
MTTARTGRVLIIDDNPSIHDDFQKVLAADAGAPAELDRLEASFFGARSARGTPAAAVELASAFRGAQGLARAEQAAAEGRPFHVAFVDMRMPPGWSGLETAASLWRVDPDLQIVFCTAYSDHSWGELTAACGATDRWVVLKKPFDAIEVRQLTHALLAKRWLLEDKQALIDSLEARVEARTRELAEANARLQAEMQERERAERALRRAHKLEALGRLAAGIGHEINNPLTVVVSNLEFIHDGLQRTAGGLPEPNLDDLYETTEEARIGAQRIRTIVRGITAFGRSVQRQRRPVDVAEVIGQTLQLVGNEVRTRARLVVQVEAVPPVHADESELEQVLVNLLLNAVRAIPEGAPDQHEIRVLARSLEGRIVIEVQDTGCGIAPDDLDQIFDPFFTRQPVNEGAGLGLAICHGIVQSLGGAITVDSTPGAGTRVQVTLPAVSGAPPAG